MNFGHTYISEEFQIENLSQWTELAKSWASAKSYFCYLNNNEYDLRFGAFPHLLAAGSKCVFTTDAGQTFAKLKEFIDEHKAPVFGYLGYDLKNEIEELASLNQDNLQFPDVVFFIPDHIIHFFHTKVTIHSHDEPRQIFEAISSHIITDNKTCQIGEIQTNLSKADYLSLVRRINNHIQDGDFYEINLCLEFTLRDSIIDPYTYYNKLNSASPMPFSAMFGAQDHFILCASPERFLKKTGSKLLSQPIKGTSKRSGQEKEDQLLKTKLYNSKKERAENMMIVDLVRNDLAKSCMPGSVTVEELFGIYSFPNVHQMISTISGIAKEDISFSQIIKNAFPMGSMTGAPKVRAIQVIEELERSKRGAFSGAAGYILPNGDFDFNVLIRSLFYNRRINTVTFHVGSAVTYDSLSEQEYSECLLKAQAMLAVLGKNYSP